MLVKLLENEEQCRSAKCPDCTGSVLLTGKAAHDLLPAPYVTARHCLPTWWPWACPPRKPRSSGREAFPSREQDGFGSEMGHYGALRLGVVIERGKRHTGLG